MKVLADMNIPQDWIPMLESYGWETVHWSEIGDMRASDTEIMSWALNNGFVVFTHDLDFSAILATTHALGPSVIQIRAQDIMPRSMERALVAALQQFEQTLEDGALMVVDHSRARVRVLPLIKQTD
jgi:predicted nuclease of predicted toxin-antitoxin system